MGTTASQRIRSPAVAGRFYLGDPARCAAETAHLCQPVDIADLPQSAIGAVVPHAGWAYSGRVAGGTIETLARRTTARTVVLTGSMHWFDLHAPATDAADAWMTPLGPVTVDGALRDAMNALEGFTSHDEAHRPEHSLEVQLPLLQRSFGADLRIVPCLAPSHEDSHRWGQHLGELLARWPEPVVVLASSDLTHYGPGYGFTPHGVAEQGLRWAREVNDRLVLDLIEAMDAETIVPHTAAHHNACGGGAIAATVAACRALGATRGTVLVHADSAREAASVCGADPYNAVGDAGVLFG